MLICMRRTTVQIDEQLFRLLKKAAARKGTTMSAMLQDALRAALLPGTKPAPSFKLRWPTVHGRLLPGVDIADRDSLYDRMESRG